MILVLVIKWHHFNMEQRFVTKWRHFNMEQYIPYFRFVEQ